MTLRCLTLLACLSAAASTLAGCNKGTGADASNSGSEPSSTSSALTTSGDDASGTSPATPTSESSTTADDSGPTPTSEDTLPPADQGGSGGQCNLFLQDCNNGEKCTAWNMDGGIFPNGTKCVPQTGDKLPGETCKVDGGFGEGVDDCVAGSLCLDIDNSGTATCVAYCSGDMQNPTCPEPEDRCAFLFEPTVPLCFPPCDPLTQNCSDDEACVPNIAALGSEYFVCMPLVFEDIPGQYGDACYAISGCDRGFQCIFAENVPNCAGDMYCCSVWCDTSMPDTCKDFDATIDCVPWYEPGQETPGYENVGICGIML
jgi:hypothetical protein